MKSDNSTAERKNMNNEHPNCFGNVTEFAWTDAFFKNDFSGFYDIFHTDVTQSASTSPFTFFGSQQVADTFTWASRFYKRCDFVHQASADGLEFLEFDLTTANNMHMTGMTVLFKDEKGKVIKVFNGHRNLTEAVIFTEHFVKGPKNKGIVALFHQRALKKYGLQPKYPRDLSNIKAVLGVTETDYIEAFRVASKQAFDAILDKSVRLSSSYVTQSIEGKEQVSSCLAAMANFYEHCLFTSQATQQNRTYLLYKGQLRNELKVSDGFLVLVRNSEGKIIEVLDNPIPLHSGTIISSAIADALSDDALNKSFYHKDLFRESVAKYSLHNVYGSKTKDLSSIKGFIAQFFLPV